jgi:arsenate reductase
MNTLAKKLLAEFIGVTVFLTAITGAILSGSGLPTVALATALGLMILLTAGVSGGHLNPAVSLFFFARKQLSATDLLGYIGAQVAGAFAGTALGSTIWQKSISAPALDNGASIAVILSELLATAGLVWIIGTLADSNRGNIIPVAVGLWVAAAAIFTSTGAQANPAVSFGLLFFPLGGHPLGTQAVLVLAQLAGALVAVVLLNTFGAKAKGSKK